MIKKKISAEIIADSINEYGNRLTTFVLVFPRIVLAEFNTHRMLSRNSASSRAIPFEKMLNMVETDPFIPIRWMKDHKGMQGNEYFEEGNDTEVMRKAWLGARDQAIFHAKYLSENGLTKQVVNRLLEPFMWHTVICTASEYENFFALRAHPAAEIHIQELAHQMLLVYNESKPKKLKAGEWHIPFGDKIDLQPAFWDGRFTAIEAKIRIATARCARISYNNFEGKDDYEADIKLHDSLAKSGHWSPFEHCARIMYEDEYYNCGGIGMPPEKAGWNGNFRGFQQYRKMFDGENKKDDRVQDKISQP